ncbi:MAG: GGDEF domain-containing protein [Alphaproteobacteria bacterium]
MKNTIRNVMHRKLYDFYRLWWQFVADGSDPNMTKSVLEAFSDHAEDMLIVDIDEKYYTYRHYGHTFVEKFSVDLSHKTLEHIPSAILPRERRQILEFEYSYAKLSTRPVWRSYSAETDGATTTWQRLTLPLSPNVLVVGVYEMPPQAATTGTPDSLERLVTTVIGSVPVTLDANGEIDGLAVSLADLTQSQLKEADLQYLASTDPLTGASNRRRLLAAGNEEVVRSSRHAHPFSVLMLDLDHFKNVNDTHGHAVGDEVLRQFSMTCQDMLRQNDLLGRCGGEEFAVLLPETEAEGARTLAERLRARVEAMRIPVENGTLTVTVSIGIAAFVPGDTLVEDLLKRADHALYQAKARGRNQVVVEGISD